MLKNKFLLEITGLVLLIIFTVLFTLVILNKKTGSRSNTALYSKKQESLNNYKTKIEISEFVLQEKDFNTMKDNPFFFRDKHKKWSAHEINKYWKNPGKILGAILEQENEKRIETLLKE